MNVDRHIQFAMMLVLVALILAGSATAFAGGPCPSQVERLSDLRGCMVNAPGTIGTTYRGGGMGAMDPDHRQLLNALHNTPLPVGHVVPAPRRYYMNPMLWATAYVHHPHGAGSYLWASMMYRRPY